jgi:hypothetical protein
VGASLLANADFQPPNMQWLDRRFREQAHSHRGRIVACIPHINYIFRTASEASPIRRARHLFPFRKLGLQLRQLFPHQL